MQRKLLRGRLSAFCASRDCYKKENIQVSRDVKYSPPKICLVSIPCDGHGTFVPQYPQGSRLMLCVLHFAGRGWHSKAKYLAVAYLPRALRKYLKLGRTRCISSCPNEAKEPYDVLLRIRLKAGVREGMIIFGCSGSSTQVVAMRDARLPDKT